MTLSIAIERARQKAHRQAPALMAYIINSLTTDEKMLEELRKTADQVREANRLGNALFGAEPNWPLGPDKRWQMTAIEKAVQSKQKGAKQTPLEAWMDLFKPFNTPESMKALHQLSRLAPARTYGQTLDAASANYLRFKDHSPERVKAQLRIAAAIAALGEKLNVLGGSVTPADRQSLVDQALVDGQKYAELTDHSPEGVASVWEAVVQEDKANDSLKKPTSLSPAEKYSLAHRKTALETAVQLESKKVEERLKKGTVVAEVTPPPPAAPPTTPKPTPPQFVPPPAKARETKPAVAPSREAELAASVLSGERREPAKVGSQDIKDLIKQLASDPKYRDLPELAQLAGLTFQTWNQEQLRDGAPAVIIFKSNKLILTAAAGADNANVILMSLWQDQTVNPEKGPVTLRTDIHFIRDVGTGKVRLLDTLLPSKRIDSEPGNVFPAIVESHMTESLEHKRSRVEKDHLGPEGKNIESSGAGGSASLRGWRLMPVAGAGILSPWGALLLLVLPFNRRKSPLSAFISFLMSRSFFGLRVLFNPRRWDQASLASA